MNAVIAVLGLLFAMLFWMLSSTNSELEKIRKLLEEMAEDQRIERVIQR
jgi:hypothetical protein